MMKNSNFLMLFALVFVFFGCSTEDIAENANNNSSNVQNINLSTGFHKMKDTPLFGNFLRNTVFKNNLLSGKTSSFLQDGQPVYIVNKDSKISYSTIVKNADASFNVYVYTKTESKESFFIAEYIPANSTSNNTMYNFTGTVNYKMINGEAVGSIQFENGKPLSPSSVHNNSKSSCTTTIVTVAHSCTSNDHHMPWQQCDLTGSNAPYYETYSTTTCDDTYQDEIYNDWSGGGSYGDSGAGGGGSVNDNFVFLLLNDPSLKSKYMSLSANIKGYLESYYSYTENAEFFKFAVNFFYANPDTTSEQFHNWFINLDGVTNLEFNNSVNTSNSISFNDLQSFKSSLLTKNNNLVSESSILQDNGSERIVSARIKRTGVWGSGEEIRIKLKKNNNIWTFDSVTSSEYGVTLGVWSFTQLDYSQNTNANILTVEVTGLENYNIFLEGLGTVYKDKVMIKVKINTNTGNIFSIEFKDL